MKKMVFALMVVFAMLVLVGCGEKSEAKEVSVPTDNSSASVNVPSPETSVPNSGTADPATAGMMEIVEHMDDKTREAIAEIPVPETNSEPAQPEPAQPEPEPAKPVADPCNGLVTSVEACQKFGGFFIQRDGKNYTIGTTVPFDQVHPYGYGTLNHVMNKTAALYFKTGNSGAVSMGNVPVLTLVDGDRLICYGKSSMSLKRLENEPSVSLRLVETRRGWTIYPMPADFIPEALPWSFDPHYLKQMQMVDSLGNVMAISDYTIPELRFGERYKMSFYNNTDYYEIDCVADSYLYNLSGESVGQFSGTLNPNGYAEFDLSGLESGLYFVEAGSYFGFIRVE